MDQTNEGVCLVSQGCHLLRDGASKTYSRTERKNGYKRGEVKTFRKRQEEEAFLLSGIMYTCASGNRRGQVSRQLVMLT